MSKMRQAAISLMVAILLFTLLPTPGRADDWESGELTYTVSLAGGEALFTIGGTVFAEDEYLSADNQLYRIASVDDKKRTAVAQLVGKEDMPDVSWLNQDAAQPVYAPANQKLIALYVTHSDESYIPSDGTESTHGKGGIYDVAEALKAALEEKGIEVVLDDTTHSPHDAGAYRRSRQTATKLAQKQPDALIDIHRDGIPNADEYNDTVDGEKVTKVRLLVGRRNQNADANKAFAKQIKAVADKQYPGLVKDIFFGKGAYNQELMPHAILLEFGTHTTSKERAIASTKMMASVMDNALYGSVTGPANGNDGGTAERTGGIKGKSSGASSGIVWMLVIGGIAVLAFAFLATGTGKGMREKIARNTSEITGGLIGKKPDKKE